MSDSGVTTGAAPARPVSRTRAVLTAALVAVIAAAGVSVLLLPTAEQWFSQREQRAELTGLTADVAVTRGTPDREGIAAAHAYNSRLAGGEASVSAGATIPTSDAGADDYEETLVAGDDGLMGRLMIPSIGADLPIYHGTSDGVLNRGIGHLEGTALPVGGDGTHAVLTGHRGLASSELFTHLDRVREDDLFSILVAGEVLTYQVREIHVVDPDQTETLYPRQGEDLVTLITCTPLGINTQRILITGARVLPTPPQEATRALAAPDGPSFPWWAAGIGLTALAGCGYVASVGRRP